MTDNDGTDRHPWYGPCDALRPDGGCAECASVAAGVISPYRLMWEVEQKAQAERDGSVRRIGRGN